MNLEIITGAIALVLTFSCFFFDSKKRILFIQWTSLLFYWFHLILLWWIISWIFLWIQVGRNFFFWSNFNRNIHTIWLVLFLLFFLVIYIFKSWLDPLSWLTLIWSILWTLGCWAKWTTNVRLLFLLSSIPWFIYVWQVGSIYPILLQSFFTWSNLINIVRFDILPRYRK